MAALYNIHVRTGCLCNPGACQTYLEISEDKLKQQFQVRNQILKLQFSENTKLVLLHFYNIFFLLEY